MRIFGICLVVAGIVWALIAFNMNTTVTSPSHIYGSGQYAITTPTVTVNNIGLMERKRDNLLFAGLTILVGVLLFGFGSIQKKRDSANNDPNLVRCPFCAELVQPGAKICKHCGRDIAEALAEREQRAASQAETLTVESATSYIHDNRQKLIDLCKKLDNKSLSFYEYQLLAPAVGATVGLVSEAFATRYSVKHHGETIVFDRVKELRPWFQRNVVPVVTGEA